MRRRIEIDAAIATMACEMYIRHVFDETLQDRGVGVLRYVLVIGAERYLAWHDDDADEMVVSPFGLWSAENVVDAIDDAVPVWVVLAGDAAGCCATKVT